MTLIQLVYASRAVADFGLKEQYLLLDKIRDKNSKVGITGILVFKDGYFLQVLEGDRDKVDSLYEEIEKDERHKNVIPLLHEEIDKRSFKDWSMGYVSIDEETEKSMPVFSTC